MHELAKTLPFFSHQIGLWNPNIFKRNFSGIACSNAHFSMDFIARHARSVRRNDNQAKAVMLFFFRIGDALGHHKIADGPVGDKHFIAVDHVIAAVFYRPCFIAGNICSGIRFSIGAGTDFFAAAYRWQIHFFLFFRTVIKNGFTAET